jgi:hypothetical protein
MSQIKTQCMKKVFMQLLTKKVGGKNLSYTLLVTMLLLLGSTLKAQIINETFEDASWKATTAAANATVSKSTSGQIIKTATSTSETVTYYTGYNQSTATATSLNTVPNSGTWFYNKASVGSSTYIKLSKARSFVNSIGVSSGGYIVTPIIVNGVATVSFYVNVTTDFAVGLYTNTTAPGQPTHASVATTGTGTYTIPTAYTYASQVFLSTSLTTKSVVTNSTGGTAIVGGAAQLVSFTGTFSGPCRVGIFNLMSSGLGIDDIVITEAAPPVTPTTQATNISFSSVTYNALTATWTNGDGGARTVFVKESAGAITNPSDGATYTASADWNSGSPSGTQLGASGYYCVYEGNENSVTLSNLNASSTYYVQVFEHNGSGASSLYITSTAAGNPNNQTTSAAPIIYNYRSKQTGDWSSVSTWEYDNGGWIDAVAAPSNDDGTITIQSGHVVTIPSSTVTADQVTIASGGSVSIATGATLVVANGAGASDLQVNGTLINAGTLTTTGTVSIENGGTYNHAIDYSGTSFTLPTATWQTNSTLQLSGTYSTATSIDLPAGTYENVLFSGNITNSGAYFRITPTDGTRIINGKLTVTETGAGPILISSINTAVAGLVVGSYEQTGGTVYINRGAGSGTRPFTVTGDVTVSGGTLDIKQGTGTSIGLLNVGGNITVSGTGAIVKSGSVGTASIVLNGTTAQAIDIAAATSITTNDLTVSNATANISLTNTGSLNVLGTFAFGNVNGRTFSANGNLILKSSSTGTARIVDITNGAVNAGNTITGDVTTETYIPGGRRAYRFLGHPFSTALSMSSLTDDIFVTGDGTTAGTGGATPGTDLDATTSNAASSYWFDQTTNGWKAFMTAADASWTQYAGTRVLVRGDRTQADALTGVAYTPNAVTVDVTGAVNTGNQNIAVSNAGNFI